MVHLEVFSLDKLDKQLMIVLSWSECFITLQAREAFLCMPRKWYKEFSFMLKK